MKVLLLGATGLLGHNVLRRLVDEGHRPVCLVRRAGGTIRLEGEGWETRVAGTLDRKALREAAEGCEAIVNCAGTTDMALRHADDYRPMNRDLCRLLVDLLEEAGIGTLVHISTTNTIGYGAADRPATEDAPMQSPFTHSPYAQSKREGESLVLEAARRLRGKRLVVLNPGYMLGPYDARPSSGRMLLAAYKRPVMLAPRGGKAFVDVRDVAQAAVNSLTRGRSGERYIVANSQGCMTLRELYRLQAEVGGYRQRVLEVPDWLLLAAGGVGDGLRAIGVRTPLSLNNVRQLLVREHYSNQKSLNELEITETPIADAIGAFHRWQEQNRKI